MAFVLSSALSQLPTGGAVARNAQGVVTINDVIELRTGAVVDTDLNCTGFVVNAGQSVTLGRDAPDGTAVPVSISTTFQNFNFQSSAFRIVGNPHITAKNVTFHMLASSNMWGSWPGAVNTTGSRLDATNLKIIAYENMATRSITFAAAPHVWIPGNGVIDGLEVTGVDGLFFNASPISTNNIQQREATNRGVSVASSGVTPVDLVGVVAKLINTQQQPCQLRITNLRLTDLYIRNSATVGTSILSLRKSVGGTLVGAGADTTVAVWDTGANQALHSRNVGTGAFDPLVDNWQVYRNSSQALTVAQIEAGVGAIAGTYVPNARIAILDYGRTLSLTEYTFSLQQPGDERPVDLSQILADSDVDERDATVVAAWSEINTSSRLRDRLHLFLRQNWEGETEEFADLVGDVINLRALDIIIDANAAQAFAFDKTTITIRASVFAGGITTTGTVTLQNGATIDGAVEDANGVRVTIRRADGLPFTLAVRSGTPGNYAMLGFGYYVNTTSETFTVPKGTPVEFAMKTPGWTTFRRTLQTAGGGLVFDAEPILNTAVDTSLDVSAFLQNIAVVSSAGQFNVIFDADMDIPGIEEAKTLIDLIVAQEAALLSTLPPESDTIIQILADEIRINRPVPKLVLGSGANDVTQRGFINTAPATAIQPSYIINPRRADNLRVTIPLNKPTLDPTVLARAMIAEGLALEATVADRPTLAQVEASTVLAKEATVADIKAKTDTLENGPALADIEASTVLAKEATLGNLATQASLDAKPTLAEIEASTVLAKEATVAARPTLSDIEASAVLAKEATLATLATQASVDALGTPLQASDYVTPPTAQQIAVEVEVAIIDEDDGRQVIKAIADKVSAEAVTATVIAQQVRTELTPELARIDMPITDAKDDLKKHVTAASQF